MSHRCACGRRGAGPGVRGEDGVRRLDQGVVGSPLSVAAFAESEGVTGKLFDEWDLSLPQLRERLERVSAQIGRKAWRFAAEMEEIAHSYGDAGLPDGFHLAAADLFAVSQTSRSILVMSVDEISKMLLGRDRPEESSA